MLEKGTFFFAVLGLMSGAQLASFRAHANSGVGDILRDADGNIRRMSQYAADLACHEQGSRLPTARELAIYSQGLGARGIRETNYPGVVTTDALVTAEIEQMQAGGYIPIVVENAHGQWVVDFYFNLAGYQRPAGDLGNDLFWTSSGRTDVTDLAYYLTGADSDFIYTYRGYDGGAVRCIR